MARPYVSGAKVRRKEPGIMIEAFPLRRFTPIDLELLRADMGTKETVSGTADHTPETAGACKQSEDCANYHKPLGSADPGEQGQDRKAHIKNGSPPTKTEALKKCRSALHFIEWGRIMETAR